MMELRDYPPFPPDYRGRPTTPPPSSRYSDARDASGRIGGPNDGPGGARYRLASILQFWCGADPAYL